MTLRLRTLLGDHPGTLALKDGSLRSDSVTFDFAEVSPTHKGFKPMVREQAFDVSEMAIVTYLMAKSFGKPMVLLPAVVMARSQHAYALTNAKLGTLTAPSAALTVPLAETARDHTGKPIPRSDFTSRTPASMTRPVTPRAISEVASRSPNMPSVLSALQPTTRMSPGRHCSTAT